MNRSSNTERRPDFFDHVLVLLFLAGIYLGIAAHLPGGIPIPCVLAGAAGLLLLMKHSGDISGRHFIPFVSVLALYLVSILWAPDYGYLKEYFKGFIQLSYSLAIVYGFFLAASRFRRDQFARVFFWLCAIIAVGGALENYVPAFRAISDSFRQSVYDFGVYASDLRDQIFYGRIRPKLFTSEPSAMTFAYTLFAFAWYVLTRHKHKIVGYLVFMVVGYFLMRGPTLLLGIGLIPVYEFLLASRRGPPWAASLDATRAIGGGLLASILLLGTVFLASILYQERLQSIFSGQDPSFFSRIIAPLLVAHEVIAVHPVSGAGLTGWEVIRTVVEQIYATAPGLSLSFHVDNPAYVVTNYFWLHWIFLGLFWGTVLLGALTWFIRGLGVPSLAFCWIVWVVFGQASGGYVDPRTWTVLLLAAVISVIHEREARQADWAAGIEKARLAEQRRIRRSQIARPHPGLVSQ